MAETLPKRPVLTVQAIEATPLVKHREIPKSMLRSPSVGKTGIPRARASGTDPVSHTVGRKGIIVPRDFCEPWRDTPQSSILIGPEAAVTLLSLGDGTRICAHRAYDTPGIFGNRRG